MPSSLLSSVTPLIFRSCLLFLGLSFLRFKCPAYVISHPPSSVNVSRLCRPCSVSHLLSPISHFSSSAFSRAGERGAAPRPARRRRPRPHCVREESTSHSAGYFISGEAARSASIAGRTFSPGHMSRKERILERIKSIRETNGSLFSSNLCKRLFSAVYMSYTSESFRLFHVSNLSVQKLRSFLFM